jgi:hypothetical protein
VPVCVSVHMTRFVAPVLLGLFALGCATETTEDIGESTEMLNGKHIPHPDGAYQATVRANGSGCPAGSWEAALSSDNETFTVTFSAFESILQPGQAIEKKECQLDLDFGSGQPIQFSVSSFYYQGYTLLEPGMTAKHETKYFFPGLREKDGNRELVGPFDDSYLYTDTVAPQNREWTQCKRNQSLRIRNRITVKNAEGLTGSGYMNTSSVDATLKFAMKWRRC